MLNYQQSTLPFRRGDRVVSRHGEVGIIEDIDRNRLQVSLDEGGIISTSVFDVTLIVPAPSSPNRINWRPRRPR